MKNQRTSLEIIAPTVQEAIAKGLAELGVPEEAVHVEILDEGSRGFLGLGTRHSRVRLSLEDQTKSIPESKTPPPEKIVEVETKSQPAAPLEIKSAAVDTSDTTLEVTRLTVQELLEKMKVKAEVTAQYSIPEDESSRQSVLVNIQGNDLSILIGRQAETLNALQYITGFD